VLKNIEEQTQRERAEVLRQQSLLGSPTGAVTPGQEPVNSLQQHPMQQYREQTDQRQGEPRPSQPRVESADLAKQQISQQQPLQQQLDAAHQEAARLRQLADEQTLQGRLEADRLRQMAEREAEAAEREQEARRQQLERETALSLQEAQKLMREEEQQLEREREHQLVLEKQADSDRALAEKLSAQYQGEYEEELRWANEDMDRLQLDKKQLPDLPERDENQSAVSAPTAAPMVMSQIDTIQGGNAVDISPTQSQPGPVSSLPTTTNYTTTAQQPTSASPQAAAANYGIAPQPTQQIHTLDFSPVTECIDMPISFRVDWFTHPAAADFTVCSRCYVDVIYSTVFRDAFARVSLGDDGRPRMCLFRSARVRSRLFPTALSSGDLGPLVAFMQARQTLPHCLGANGVEGRQWYYAPEMPGIEFCPACFEDGIAVPFGGRFTVSVPEGRHACDASVLHHRRMLATYAQGHGDWPGLVASVNARARVPACPGASAVAPAERAWFASRRGPDGFVVCEACYLDVLHGTPNAAHFAQGPAARSPMQCAMGSNLNISIPAREAVQKRDWTLLWRAVEGVAANPHCAPTGVRTASWWTLPNDPADFGVCGGCFVGIIEPLGGANLFIRKSVAGNGDGQPPLLLCCLNPGHPRIAKFLANLAQAMFTNDWQSFGHFAARFAAVAPCRGINRSPTEGSDSRKSRRRWGWSELTVCEDCYLSFAAGSPLEPCFAHKGEAQMGEGELCDLWSPRMRRLWREAEAKVDNGGLDELLRFARHRQQVYLETIPQCEMLLQQQRLAAQQAQMLGVMGTTYKAMGGAVDAVQGHAYTVGNALVGHGYANQMLLDGAVYDRQSRDVAAGVAGPMVQIAMLEQRWKTVE
jgi:hypothetical protein